jgi:uncharacterized LabA/DUF88 family protein
MERVTILVDVQNIYYTTRQAYNQSFDYNEFWRQATAGKVVVQAIAYSCDRGDSKQQQFQNILRAIGFQVKLKPYIQRADGSAKCDWDVGITIDALKYVNDSDVIILATGDGDFDILATKIKNEYGKFIEVYGVPQLTASSLINSASNFVPIENNLLLNPKT